MNKILKIQFTIFIILTLISIFSLGNIWLPLMMLLSMIIGPFMAYDYSYSVEDYIIITFGFVIAGILMFYGVKKQTFNKGILAFISGYWLWTAIGLFAGLGTGT